MLLLTQREAASVLRLSERTLERLRVSGLGPKFCRMSRCSDCWIDQRSDGQSLGPCSLKSIHSSRSDC
jgi:hypothetical protein